MLSSGRKEPLSVRPSPRTGAFLAGSAAIGLGYGGVAWRMRSLRATVLPPFLTDASGMRGGPFWLSRGPS